MDSSSATYLIAAVVALLIAFIVIGARQKRRKALVICPPANLPAEVTTDSEFRIIACTRLPDGHKCDRACLPQLGFAAADLGAFLETHGGKSCANCGTVISADDWYKSRLRHQAATAIKVKSGADTHLPVCWDCFAGMDQQPG